ncbi:hypothetical protein [Pseudoruegeria sp. SK021]|uniref:hypothetical protein n=1 Tax=Pseudoruegeria sp. SK021 TaxID=1933035 RepID=UPI000A2446B1|nr:hypothetical protein [Pseudoruegeria sp. SK021]OSP55219.1 hypothetical protein BV911_08270 [Pseudoruegeria sp. SK021]
MSDPRRITHPGPPAAVRFCAVPCRATPQKATFRAGASLLEAMVEAGGADAAWFDLSGVTVRHLAFVRPAPAPGDGHAAWYSATTTLEDARIIRAGAHLGRRNGLPFAHVHGIWSDKAGQMHMGHLLSDVTIIGQTVDVDVQVLDGARMESADDPETGFCLFRPVSTGMITTPNAVLATARPNQTIEPAIANIARDAGIASATIKGIGSLVRTEFSDRDGIESYATEVLLTAGHLSISGVDLTAASVGFDGRYADGQLARGKNTICVTFELLLNYN